MLAFATFHGVRILGQLHKDYKTIAAPGFRDHVPIHVTADFGLQYTALPLAQRRLDKSPLVQGAFVGTKCHALLAAVEGKCAQHDSRCDHVPFPDTLWKTSIHCVSGSSRIISP